MDFLYHKVLIARLLSCLSIPLNLNRLLFNLIAIEIVEGNLSIFKTSHLQIADIIYISRIL